MNSDSKTICKFSAKPVLSIRLGDILLAWVLDCKESKDININYSDNLTTFCAMCHLLNRTNWTGIISRQLDNGREYELHRLCSIERAQPVLAIVYIITEYSAVLPYLALSALSSRGSLCLSWPSIKCNPSISINHSLWLRVPFTECSGKEKLFEIL